METASYVVEQFGPWRPANIRIRFDRHEFRIAAEQAGLVNDLWRQQQAEAARRGFEMFNGKLARLASSAGQSPAASPDGELALVLQPTDFKTFLATNLTSPESFAPAERANAMGVSTIVRTSDRRVLFGRRSQRVAYNRGKLHTIGGVLDWIRPATGDEANGGWLIDQLFKELYEELTLQPEEISLVQPLVLARDRRVWQPELLCLTDVKVGSSELTRRWRQSGEYEHDDLWTCADSAAGVVDGVTRLSGQFTPVGLAAALAYLSIYYPDDALAAALVPGA